MMPEKKEASSWRVALHKLTNVVICAKAAVASIIMVQPRFLLDIELVPCRYTRTAWIRMLQMETTPMQQT